ncbi:hypothetical protein [Metabacillus litoralis]|uniref:hypothetical protein n=1 Tax=Metabacillus litoralis TaxID=152268 RepID=UPI001CFDD6B8|nr:hypothetical protein [Metabacillus litoralis]
MERFFSKAEQWQQDNILLRVTYSKARVGTITFSGRVIQISPDQKQLLFYNDDTKSVLNLELNAIDDVLPFEN